MIVGYQGEPGAFSEEAATRYFGSSATCLGYATFAQLIRAVALREVEYALLPIENSIVGALHEPRALLAAYPQLETHAEIWHPIEQCLIGVPGATLAGVHGVVSHPVALAQCARTLARFQQTPADDTAGAVRAVVKAADPQYAAIGPARAARLYGGVILAAGVSDAADNKTRFAVVRRRFSAAPGRLSSPT